MTFDCAKTNWKDHCTFWEMRFLVNYWNCVNNHSFILPPKSIQQTWLERFLLKDSCRHDKLQNFHVEVTESQCGGCRCDLARRVGLQETRWPTFSVSEMPSEARRCGALHRVLGSTVSSGSLDVEPRHGSHAARAVSSLNTHWCNVTHKGQAIKISECRPLWLMVVTMVTREPTERACVRARLHQWARKPGGVQSVTTATEFFHTVQVDFQCVPAPCDVVAVIGIPARKALNFASDPIITVLF